MFKAYLMSQNAISPGECSTQAWAKPCILLSVKGVFYGSQLDQADK